MAEPQEFRLAPVRADAVLTSPDRPLPARHLTGAGSWEDYTAPPTFSRELERYKLDRNLADGDVPVELGMVEYIATTMNNTWSSTIRGRVLAEHQLTLDWTDYDLSELVHFAEYELPELFKQRALAEGYAMDVDDIEYARGVFFQNFMRADVARTDTTYGITPFKKWADLKLSEEDLARITQPTSMEQADIRMTEGERLNSLIEDIALVVVDEKEELFEEVPNSFTHGRQFLAIWEGISQASGPKNERFLAPEVLKEIKRAINSKSTEGRKLRDVTTASGVFYSASRIASYMTHIDAETSRFIDQIYGSTPSEDLELDVQEFANKQLSLMSQGLEHDQVLETLEQHQAGGIGSPTSQQRQQMQEYIDRIEKDPTAAVAIALEESRNVPHSADIYGSDVERNAFKRARAEIEGLILSEGGPLNAMAILQMARVQVSMIPRKVADAVDAHQQTQLDELIIKQQERFKSDYKGVTANEIINIAASRNYRLSESAANTILLSIQQELDSGRMLYPLAEVIDFWAKTPVDEGEAVFPYPGAASESNLGRVPLLAGSYEDHLRLQRGTISGDLQNTMNLYRILRGEPALVGNRKITINTTPLIGPESSAEYVDFMTKQLQRSLLEAQIQNPDFSDRTVTFIKEALQDPKISQYIGIDAESSEQLWRDKALRDAQKAEIAKGSEAGVQARLVQLGIIDSDTPPEQINFATIAIMNRLPWDRINDPTMSDDEKFQQLDNVISELFPGEYARTARTDYDRGGPSLPGQFGQEPTFPAEGWRGPAERQEEDARLTALSQQEDLERRYSQQVSPLGPGSYRDPFTGEGIAGPAAIPEAPGMDLRRGRFAGDIFSGEFDPMLTGVEAEREQTEFVRAARALAEEEAARMEDDPARQGRLASQLLQDFLAREESFMPQYESELTKRFETSQKNLLASFRTGELHKALQGLSREEAVDYSRQLFGMEQQDATRRVREDFPIGKFLRTKLPTISEQRGLLNFELSKAVQDELSFERGLAQAQQSARISQAMREDPIFRGPRGRGRTIVL